MTHLITISVIYLGQIIGKEELSGAQPTEVFLAAFESAKKL